jgi:hypothetical protein
MRKIILCSFCGKEISDEKFKLSISKLPSCVKCFEENNYSDIVGCSLIKKIYKKNGELK